MIEFRTRIMGAVTREVYEEYSPIKYPDLPDLIQRFSQAATRVAFCSAALEAAGVGEPLVVDEEPIAHRLEEVAIVRAME